MNNKTTRTDIDCTFLQPSHSDKLEETVFRSEEVQEVMGQIPPWLLRRGITALFVIIVILLVGCCFFKYPDVIQAEVTVTSLEPPVSVVARSTGKIDEIYVRNNQTVHAETVLAVIQNPANTKDVLRLIEVMHEWEKAGYPESIDKKIFDETSMNLGSIQSAYASFLNSLNDYRNYKTLNYYPQKIASQRTQLVTQKEYYHHVVEQSFVVREQFYTSKSIFERDSLLYSKSVISSNEYDLSKNNFLQTKQACISLEASLRQSELQLIQGKENLLDLQQQATELERKYRLSLQNAIEMLNAQIKMWEHDYLLVSPIDGIVNQMGIWSNNQNVNVGETIFTIVPGRQNVPKGKAMLPVQGAGKVKAGQRVNVRITNFPDQEFGFLIGKVESVSRVPTAEGFYVVEINFPDGMKTNYGKILPITQQMQGSGDIITDDLRLIERFFMPIKKLLKERWL